MVTFYVNVLRKFLRNKITPVKVWFTASNHAVIQPEHAFCSQLHDTQNPEYIIDELNIT